jgi:hypothetical protein
VDSAICYPDARARADLAAVLRWRIVAVSGLALAHVALLQVRFGIVKMLFNPVYYTRAAM